MVISSTLPATAPAATSTATTGGGSSDPAMLTQNFNTFLTLLTTQLKNQDPLSPLDTNQFTQQLVSFSQVEQAIDTNKNLQTLISLQNSSQTVSALPLVGRTIEYADSAAPLANGQASFSYTLPSNAAAAALTVVDANGKTVFSQPATAAAGRHAFTWNGTTSAGTTAPDGVYALKVLAADAAGTSIPATVTALGRVDGVSVVNNVATFDVGGVKVPMSELLTIQPASN
ncbi:MAG: flagellar hook assembly protein FlgD [Acidobacteriota bacterium]